MPNIDYTLNDPVAPIKLRVPVPSDTDLKYHVTGYSPEKQNAEQVLNCYVSVGNTINTRLKALAKSKKVTNWAATQILGVNPSAGKDLNAYYDRTSLKFFYYPMGDSVVYTANSSDIVTHELGHALLDAIRPDFWSVQSLEIWAFHEAFADINAMMAIMDYPAAIEAAIKETDKDMRRSNIVSRLAEQLGAIIYGRNHLFLRDAVNNFKYQDPNTLPNDAPDEKLCSECHSFGRVFLGAWYEIMCGIYEQELKTNEPVAALTTAKNVAADYMYKAVVQSPRIPAYHYAIAKGMLLADAANECKYKEPLTKALQNRNMLPEVKALSSVVSKKEFVKGLKENDVVTKRGKTTVVVVKDEKTVRLADFRSLKALSGLTTEGINLAEMKLEVPSDSYYEFDENGQLCHQIVPSDEALVQEAHRCAEILASKNEVGKNKMWKVAYKRLRRSYVR